MEGLLLGLTLGVAAGLSPGPLLVLVVTESLRSGWRAGVLVSFAPLASDAVVVATTLLVLGALPAGTLAVVGVVGGGYVAWTGITTWRDAGAPVAPPGAGVPVWTALRRAVAVNLLSPHPWVAWATALGPLTVRTWREAPFGGAALVAGFYLTLVAAKVVVALLVAAGRSRLGGTGHRRALRAAAVLLVLAGAGLVWEFAPAVL